jgi:hypothetical protein
MKAAVDWLVEARKLVAIRNWRSADSGGVTGVSEWANVAIGNCDEGLKAMLSLADRRRSGEGLAEFEGDIHAYILGRCAAECKRLLV